MTQALGSPNLTGDTLVDSIIEEFQRAEFNANDWEKVEALIQELESIESPEDMEYIMRNLYTEIDNLSFSLDSEKKLAELLGELNITVPNLDSPTDISQHTGIPIEFLEAQRIFNESVLVHSQPN